MKVKQDLTGRKFSKLSVVDLAGRSKQGDTLWRCMCECGKEKVVRGSKLLNSHTRSCGCLQREKAGSASRAHGLYYEDGKKSKLYGIWIGMKGRCNNPNDSVYQHYGQRGISVCDEWLEFSVFHTWAIANGYKPGLTIERVLVNEGYRPDNCKWIPRNEQSKNTRKSRIVIYQGLEKRLTEWADILGFDAKAIRQRIDRGWPIDKAFTTPI
jgi:hypothetical protein